LEAKGIGTPSPLTGLGNDFQYHRGNISFGSTEQMALLPVGAYQFTREHTQFDPSVWRLTPIGVTGIYIQSADLETRGPITGNVTFSGGTNVLLRAETENSKTVILVDAYDGSGFNDEETTTASKPGIKTINGKSPDSAGDFVIVGGTCVEITASAGMITIEDTCSSPCCGCAELETVTSQLETLQTRAEDLNTGLANLQTEVTRLGHVSGDAAGCLQCNKRDFPTNISAKKAGE
jgi:hypothetical protein